jgi:SnoaL-like domain
MSVEDKLAIHEMIARYSYAYDGKESEAVAQLFVEDGIFEVIVPGKPGPTVRLSSRVAICEWAKQRFQLNTSSQARHYQSGVLFDELTAETASARTMLLLTRQNASDAAPVVHLTGIYHDKWRKTREGWRLVRRAACIDRDPGFAKHWA